MEHKTAETRTAAATEPAVDRRVRRSRRALRGALVALSAERGYDLLTVDDLTSHADMARRTFYAHYVDKDALLTSVVQELLDELQERVADLIPDDLRDAQGDIIRAMFAHGQDNRDVYRMVLAGAGNGIGLRMLSNTLSQLVQDAFTRQQLVVGVTPRLPLDFVARCFIGQHLTLLRWWLDTELYDLEQISAMRRAMWLHGELWALGFDEGGTTQGEQG